MDPKTARDFPDDLRGATTDSEGCRKMLISSLVDRMYLYEDHFRTLFNNSDKHGGSSKHEATEVERYFDSMNGSEKVSSETSLGCFTIEKKAIDSGWSLFCCLRSGPEPLTAYLKKEKRNENR